MFEQQQLQAQSHASCYVIYALFAAGIDFDRCDNSDTSQDQEDNRSKMWSHP